MPKYRCTATMGTDLYCVVEAKDKDDAIEQMKELAHQGVLIEYGDGFFDFDWDAQTMPDDAPLEPCFEENDDA